jgi:upstream activation factor subunit UAF30
VYFLRSASANTRSLQNAVKELIMERFDRAHNNPSVPASTASSTLQTNGYSSAHNNSNPKPKKEARAESKVKLETPASSTPGGDYGDDSDTVSPPKKKRKHAESSEELDDAKLAAMLQAQENRFVSRSSSHLSRNGDFHSNRK